MKVWFPFILILQTVPLKVSGTRNTGWRWFSTTTLISGCSCDSWTWALSSLIANTVGDALRDDFNCVPLQLEHSLNVYFDHSLPLATMMIKKKLALSQLQLFKDIFKSHLDKLKISRFNESRAFVPLSSEHTLLGDEDVSMRLQYAASEWRRLYFKYLTT